MKKDRIWIRKYIGIAIMLCLAMTMNTACGGKYEPIVLNQGPQGTEKDSSGEQENHEKRIQVETQGDVSASNELSAQKTESANKEAVEESAGTSNQEDSSSAVMDTKEPEDMTAEAGTLEDNFYQQCGMLREEAETYRIGIIEDVMSENKDAVAARFVYPKTVTVSSGTFEVKSAEEFLSYYDEIFTETFKQNLDMEAEQELFCHNGMISFGSGLIWFSPVYGEESVAIITINGTDGSSVRNGGTPGAIQE